MKLAGVLIALGALSTQVLGAPTINVDGKERTVFVPQWEVEVTPGGEKVVLNGTVQEVHQELLRRNPKWNEHFGFNPELAARDASSASIEPRDTFHFFCNGRWAPCSYYRISQGVSYLRGIKGRPTNGAGPGNCGRVSCSYNSAIWWCNDDTKSKTLSSFGQIGDGAAFLQNNCNSDQTTKVAGQVFYPDNWNVIVRADKC